MRHERAREPALSSSESASLERGYRRLLAWYPKWFRLQNTEEVLAVLMACAQEGQTRPSLETAADLLKGAARMRPRPGQPRTVFAAVWLMIAAAAAELGVMVTVLGIWAIAATAIMLIFNKASSPYFQRREPALA